jgi:L-fuconolactonase
LKTARFVQSRDTEKTRAMFQSNLPVDKGSCGYAALWNTFKRITAGCSVTEKQALFSGTAAKFYRLGDRPSCR